MSNQKDDTAVVEQAAHEKAVADAKAEGAAEATARIGKILDSEEAKGREELARHFAFKTSMSAEDALAALAVSPKAEQVPGGNAVETKTDANAEGGFDAAMSQDNPNVGASGGTDAKDSDDVVAATFALAKELGLPFVKAD